MNWEITTFIAYFVILLGVALVFYFNGTNKNSEDFFLGGRSMGPWVTALSAQASDMSAWLLMGLPGSILAFGFGQMWIGIGLAIGTAANWWRKSTIRFVCWCRWKVKRHWITWTKSSTSKGLMACLLDLRIFLRRWATRITPGTRKCSELLKPVFGGSVLRVKRLVFWLWLLIWRSNAWRGERTLSLLALTRCSTAMPWINDWRCLNQAKMGHA